MYKHLLFDADNTLLDFNEGERCALRGALSSSPLEFSDDVYERYHHINDRLWKELELGLIEREELRRARFERLFDEFGFDGAEYGAGMDEIFLEHMKEQAQLMDGAAEVVRELAKKYKLYIVTNASLRIQPIRLSKTFFGEVFEKYYISEAMGVNKPKKEFFDYVINDIGDEKTSFLVIGDSLSSDIKGAEVSGIDSCYLDHSRRGAGDHHPTFIINELRELLQIL